MRLGVTGTLPADFRTFTPAHFREIQTLGCTGAGFHFPGNLLDEIDQPQAETCRTLFAQYNIDLAQFSVTYPDCLFHPDPESRTRAIQKITRGAQLANWLHAQTFLLRPGSLNPAGSWTPHRDNHTPEAFDRLVDTLKKIVPHLESHGVTAVMETHVISILNTPERCRELVESVNSPSFRLVLDSVNHFETLQQVYTCQGRLDHIFEQMGPLAPVCHVKDIVVGDQLVLHLNETVPGEGELDIAHMLRRFHEHQPDGYVLIEHLGPEQIPAAVANVRRIAEAAHIPIYGQNT
ncbi:MAG: sugar phosphate isomerase/epimerase [bacterium]|nr:sugar phosphate isomerase/epimerase [bacterium]